MRAARRKRSMDRVTMSIRIAPDTYYRLHQVRLARCSEASRLPALQTLIDEALLKFVGRDSAR